MVTCAGWWERGGKEMQILCHQLIFNNNLCNKIMSKFETNCIETVYKDKNKIHINLNNS
jgi:hypothetical protein